MTGLGEDVWEMPKLVASTGPLQTITSALSDIAAELGLDETDNEKILIAISVLKSERTQLRRFLKTYVIASKKMAGTLAWIVENPCANSGLVREGASIALRNFRDAITSGFEER